MSNNKSKLLDLISKPSDFRDFDNETLTLLADEVREEILNIVSKIGGHLGASLGVVELTIALHYVFNTPEDLLIWDIGHQAYTHKILTGRRHLMNTIRKSGGLSGFLKRSESIYDVFGAGHSSTSISAAIGFAAARDFNNENHEVIAVIGDGAMSAGMAYEAMNNAASMKNRIIVVLNDNKMSIAPAVGAMSKYLTNLISSKPYSNVRNFAKNVLQYFPAKMEEFAKKAERYAKDFATGGNFFSEMGFYYIGPVDGHDMSQLVEVFNNIKNNKNITSPILVHVMTEKGKGFNSPDSSLESYHAVKPFDITTKAQKKAEISKYTYTDVFANTLIELAAHDEKIIGITAAMPSGTGMDKFLAKYPTRMFDVGIAEQHAVTFASGLAAAGFKPFVAIYSTFLQRAYDQIVHDVAIQNLPVRFAIDRAGLVGPDGPTHAGAFDIACLINLPNFVIMAPSNEDELASMIQTAASISDRPSAIRYPRAEILGDKLPNDYKPLAIGKSKIVIEGEKVAVVSLGTRLQEVLAAAKIIKEEFGIQITVVDARFAKPLDIELLKELVITHEVLLTIEESTSGGFGAYLFHHLLEHAYEKKISYTAKFHSMCFPDRFLEQADVASMYREAGLDFVSISNRIRDLIKH
ncbi:1-deoxy-D-xylulose-5-phosphate synthase [Candidatus Lariskella endosymbiont of Epinotia ramella]|uniref:1-deoxy-D-xylulose-5-phosphate synthase n=1 Tax=Candidatus Lariskella endosymbiont of Epinotia ramella TaxID=3066224 RepID=UPI0030D60ADD